MLSKRLPIKIDDEKLKKLWPTRLPDKVLAVRMGHGLGALHRRARRLGLPYRRQIWGMEDVE